MAMSAAFVTLEELLEETAATDEDNEILERVKLVAQEHMPPGWTSWKVSQLTKEDVFGDQIDPQVLNKLRFALPADELARCFDPDATHLPEKYFRDIKVRLLDWAFARALITSPPAVCNKIRGSFAATEMFNRATRQVRQLSRKEADRALLVDRELEEPGERPRKRQGSTVSRTEPKRSRLDVLEEKMEAIGNTMSEIMRSLSGRAGADRAQKQEAMMDDEDSEFNTDESCVWRSRSQTPVSWHAPPMGSPFDAGDQKTSDFDFLPAAVKVDEPAFPAPSDDIKMEGIAWQRFGSEDWNKIRYKDGESALKLNAELAGKDIQTSDLLNKQDQLLGSISHGLLCQQKVLSDELKKLAGKFPHASGDLMALLAEDSDFGRTSDDLLQFVSAQRAETIEMHRKSFTAKDDAN